MPVSVSPNPEQFKTNGSKKLFQVSAPVIAAPARFPQHAALSKQFFWQKNCRGRYRNVGVGDPSIFRMARWSAPKMGGYYEARKKPSRNLRNPLFMHSLRSAFIKLFLITKAYISPYNRFYAIAIVENHDLLLLPKTDRHAANTIHCFTRCNSLRTDDYSPKKHRIRG